MKLNDGLKRLCFSIGIFICIGVGCKKQDTSVVDNSISDSDSQITNGAEMTGEDEIIQGAEVTDAASNPNSEESTKGDSLNDSHEEEMQLFNSIIQNTKLKADKSVRNSFLNVSVHDPSIIEVDGTYYIFGSHLGAAKSSDLINWEMIDSGVTKNNKIIPDAMTEMKGAFEWAKTNTFWAPDVIQLEDGRYYMYYCTCEGSSPLSTLGIAVADNIEGPYKDLGIILKSGMSDTYSENGDKFDATKHPNVVDPCVFFDKENRLWMIYGSYSGGIYILELNKETGFPLESGYGTKLLGANHLRIEGAFVQYSKETDYYYMFLSYGGLSADGGYNIRVSRSKNPDGPYEDAAGNAMILCRGGSGTFFDDKAAAEYGSKLMGNYHFKSVEGEEAIANIGYVSPGHNSTIYDEVSNKYFIIFHTRFEGRGENHQVRVHQMFLNEEGWFVVAPYRYVGESIQNYEKVDVIGAYKIINHGRDITAEIKYSENIVLTEENKIIGDYTGTWELKEDNICNITIDDITYRGVFLEQWDENNAKNVMTFTVMSKDGVTLWGSGYQARE